MTALALIQKAVKPHQQKGTAAVVKYVNDALDPISGAAYWANPEGANGPEGAFQSDFIVKTLAEHVKAMEGSQLEVSHFPIGAFILAITAVSRAFLMFSTGAFINAGSFSKENIGNLTTEWSDGAAVKTFLAKTHRMDELLNRIDDFLNKKPTPQQTRTATQNQYCTLSKAAATIVDQSSPPAPEVDE
ncbi:hypothetical protein EWM64_g8753 [Hericium alpestre]|uniref:Uncharacterized protein n=1 Tax=Hericium alpestre TaxID=135208 RepID=A0A4Y9ZN41_9AGAM|nr:hypothetical protein EWM64_g8753 [Hericium alpestre]